MKLLLDTNIIIQAAGDLLSIEAEKYISDERNELYYSSASIWEIAIKRGLNRRDFDIDPHILHKALTENGYIQLPITAEHTLLTGTLPQIHKDPFDRILVAQSMAEGISLLTTDKRIAGYPAPVILV